MRVVCLSSLRHIRAPSTGIVFDQLKTDMESTSTITRYGQSKLANLLIVKELAKRYPDVTSVSLHPGVVATNLYDTFEKNKIMWAVNTLAKKIYYVTTEVGAKGQLWAATTPLENLDNGEYYTPIGVTGGGSKLANDVSLAKKLWEWTEKELEGYTI